MQEEERLKKIKQSFLNLKDAHEWCMEHFPSALGLAGEYTKADEIFLLEEVVPAVERQYDILYSLGVEKTFSAALFVFGALFTRQLVNQFRKNE